MRGSWRHWANPKGRLDHVRPAPELILSKIIKGRLAILHGQGTLEVVKAETGSVGPVEFLVLLDITYCRMGLLITFQHK